MEYSYNEIFTRSIRLIGEDAQERLHHAHAAVFGLGGVGRPWPALVWGH